MLEKQKGKEDDNSMAGYLGKYYGNKSTDEVLNDLRNIDTFVLYQNIGNTDMLDAGFLGTIYGLQVIRVSTNAGMTNTSAYVTDKAHAYIIAEKRPVTVEGFDLQTHDMSGVVVTQRIKVDDLRSSAIAKITTS